MPNAEESKTFFDLRRTAAQHHQARRFLNLLVAGKHQKQIADQLFLSPFTIATHMKNLYAKLHVHCRSAAVAKALKEHLL